MKFTLLVVMLILIIIGVSRLDDGDCPRGSTVAAGIGLCK